MKVYNSIRTDATFTFLFLLLITAGTINLSCTELPEMNTKKTLEDFDIRATNLFLYYEDLDRATSFYTEILGIELVADYGMASILRVAQASYLILVDAEKGMHSSDEPKSVAVALITDQLEEWYTYLKTQDVEFKYDFNPSEGQPHDGFVILDPEGYYLEFERFNPHPENEKLTPLLSISPKLFPPSGQQTTVPAGLGFKAMVTWLYYKDIVSMQRFYEDVLGLNMIVDQGWVKIYQVSATGFTGLVDETRGMHSYAEQKAATVSFIIDDVDGWFEYSRENDLFELRSSEVEDGPDGEYRAFVGYDPEGYYLEFDRFFEHERNRLLLGYLNEAVRDGNQSE